MRERVCVLLMLVCVGAGTAMGQRGMGGMGGGMGRGGRGMGGMGRGGGMMGGNSDAAKAKRDSVLDERGYAGFVMDHKAPLNLSDSQMVALVKVDSAYRAATDTVRPQLARVRAANAAWIQEAKQRAATDTLTATEKDSVLARRKLLSGLAAALRTAQQADKTATLAQLSQPQQTQAIQMAEGDIEPEDGRPSGGRGGRGGWGGGQGGAPPSQ